MKKFYFLLITIIISLLLVSSYAFSEDIKLLYELGVSPIQVSTDTGILTFYGLPGLKDEKHAFARIFTYSNGLANYKSRKEYYKKTIMHILLQEELNNAKFLEEVMNLLKENNEEIDAETIGTIAQSVLKGTDIGTTILTQLSKDLNLKYIKDTGVITKIINKLKTHLRAIRAGALNNFATALNVIDVLSETVSLSKTVSDIGESFILSKALQADLAEKRLSVLEKYSSIKDKAFREAIDEIRSEMKILPSDTWKNLYLSILTNEKELEKAGVSIASIGTDLYAMLGHTISGPWAGTVIFGYKTYKTIENYLDALRISVLSATIYESLPKDVSNPYLSDIIDYSQYLFLLQTISAFTNGYEKILTLFLKKRRVFIETLEEYKRGFELAYYRKYIKKAGILVKVESAWKKTYGGSGDDIARSIQQTTDGGYIVVGYTNSNNGNVSGNHGKNDYWIVKLDASGNIQWQKIYGGSDDDIAFSIQQTSDGGYILAGWTKSQNEM